MLHELFTILIYGGSFCKNSETRTGFIKSTENILCYNTSNRTGLKKTHPESFRDEFRYCSCGDYRMFSTTPYVRGWAIWYWFRM